MTRRVFIAALGIATLTALAAAAHQGVTNPAVMARMEGMKTVANQMKILGAMSKGQTDFNAATARLAGKTLVTQATAIEPLFEAPEYDPKSEASETIWTNWDDFRAKALEFEEAARLARVIETPDDLRAAMGALGASCKSCHQDYRIEN